MADEYIKIRDLLDFCANQKDHSITPNDIMRMNHVGWISVKDRLPDNAGKYLIVALEQGKFQHVTTAYFGRHFNMTGRMSHWRVTHWMPLPSTEGLNET